VAWTLHTVLSRVPLLSSIKKVKL